MIFYAEKNCLKSFLEVNHDQFIAVKKKAGFKPAVFFILVAYFTVFCPVFFNVCFMHKRDFFAASACITLRQPSRDIPKKNQVHIIKGVKKSNNERLTKILLLFLFLKELKFFTPEIVNKIKPAELLYFFLKNTEFY